VPVEMLLAPSVAPNDALSGTGNFAAEAGPLSLAIPCRQCRPADGGTVGDAVGGYRLAPAGMDGTTVARGLNISPIRKIGLVRPPNRSPI
jgi:hypothetical protein